MSELRIKTAIDNGDLPKDCDKLSQPPSAQLELFETQEPRDTTLEEFDELVKSIFGKEKNK